MKIFRYSLCIALIFTISIVMTINSTTDAWGCEISRSYMSMQDCRGEDLSFLSKYMDQDFSGMRFYHVDFSGANLSGIDFSFSTFYGVNFSNADLSGANLSNADLSGDDFRGANLSGTILSNADLSGANLIGADLSDAKIKYANLKGAILVKEDLIDNPWKSGFEKPTETAEAPKPAETTLQMNPNNSNPDNEKIKNSIDCTLKNPPRWDKTAEKGEQFSISWDNPDRNICKYYVVMYDQNKNKFHRTTGSWTGIVSSLEITQNFADQSYFKICNAKENWCSKFLDVNVIDRSRNDHLAGSIANTKLTTEQDMYFSDNPSVLVTAILVVIGISGYVIYLKTKKSTNTTSIEKPQEESITDIDKQIAINEEKIRKIEEESKRLDDEN